MINIIASIGARMHGQLRALGPPCEKVKMDKSVILCPKKLLYRHLVTFEKPKFDLECVNCRVKVKN